MKVADYKNVDGVMKLVYREATAEEEQQMQTYNELDKVELINSYKQQLADSDYKAIKYSEGWYTDEEYKEIKEEREKLRQAIRDLENN